MLQLPDIKKCELKNKVKIYNGINHAFSKGKNQV